MEKLDSDHGYIKNLISQIESRIEGEIDRRLKHEFESKNFIETKLALFREEYVII